MGASVDVDDNRVRSERCIALKMILNLCQQRGSS
jgi:hypothetical protein